MSTATAHQHPFRPVDDHPASPDGDRRRPVVEVVVPVYDEQEALAGSVRRLHGYLSESFPYPFRITIADNASTDQTWTIATMLARELPGVHAVRLESKGRGGALHHIWARSDADVVSYMDVDLSTGLEAFLPLVAPLLSGHSDVAIGSRLSRTARVVRGPRREIISRCYNLMLRATLRTRFSDAQCGFKAVRTDRVRQLLPLIEDNGWFFDTELLVIAERIGLRIHEVPVDWTDDPDSRVDIVATAIADLKGIARLGRGLLTGAVPIAALRAQVDRQARAGSPERSLVGQLASFGVIGIASTIGYLLLYAVLHPALGAQGANLLALLLTAIANTAANRRITFGMHGRTGAARHQMEGLAVFAASVVLTSGALAVLHALDPAPSLPVEGGVLVAANLAATLLRFVLFRAWVFNPSRSITLTRSEDR